MVQGRRLEAIPSRLPTLLEAAGIPMLIALLLFAFSGHATATTDRELNPPLNKSFSLISSSSSSTPPTGGSSTSTPPSIAIIAPTGGEVVLGLIDVSANATDSEDAFGSLTVEYSIGSSSSTEAMVFNATTGLYHDTWDTSTVADGTQALHARATDSDGNSTDAAPISVTVDNVPAPISTPTPSSTSTPVTSSPSSASQPAKVDTPPDASIVEPPDGATLVGNVTILVEAIDDDDAPGTLKVEYAINGGGFTFMDYSASTGFYEANWDTTAVNDGPHIIEAQVTDSFGTRRKARTITVTVDNIDIPPSTAIVSPANGEVLVGQATVQVSASDIEDVEGTLAVEFSIDGGPNMNMAYNADSGNYEASWYTTTVSDGLHTVDARVLDSGGNTTNAISVIVEVDNIDEPPSVSLIFPQEGYVATGVTVIRAVATDIEDAEGTLGAAFSIDGSAFELMTYNPSSGYYEATWSSLIVSDGIHTLEALATDSSGNSTSSTQIVFSVENVNEPPVASIVSPSDGELVFGIIQVEVDAKDAEDPQGTLNAMLSVDGGPFSPMTYNSNTGLYEALWDSTIFGDVDHTITAHVTDSGGNVETPMPIVVTSTNISMRLLAITRSHVVNFVNGPNTVHIHSPDVIIGANTFNSVGLNGPINVLDTADASIAVREVEVPLTDTSNIGIFVSEPVPAASVWDISGQWTFSPYISTTVGTRLWVRARIYRIDASGVPTEVLYSQNSTRYDTTTAFQLLDWNDTVAAGTVLNSGERFGVAFFVFPDSDESGESAIMGFDDVSAPSSVVSQVVESVAPGSVREAHFRIGKDTALNAMEWYAGVDSAATDVTRNTNLRVRFQLYNEGDAVTWTPRLEWTETPGSGYSTVPLISGAAPFFVTDTLHHISATTIATANFGLGAGTGTAQGGIAYDSENPAGSVLIVSAFSYTEVEFNVQANSNAVNGRSYFFRLTDSGAPLTSYDSGDAQIVVQIPAPLPPPEGPPAHNFHMPYAADTSSCAACHRVHTSVAPTALQKQWPEEEVCFTCHDGTGAPDILTSFSKAFRMPITSTAGIHSLTEPRTQDPASFSGVNRHVECTDCHNPHFAAAGNHTIGSNYAFGPQQGVWGVSVSNGASWTAPSFTPVDRVTFQYELCLKCHSSWAYGTGPPLSPSGGFPQTDQAKEFNTLNPSYHPVEGPGKNPFVLSNGTSYASSLLGGFTPTSRMTCSDCHASETATDPAGPHGSTKPFILRGDWNRTTGQMPNQRVPGPDTSDHLCFTCHDINVYTNPNNDRAPWDERTGFSGDGRNLHSVMVGARNKADNDAAIVCMDCHVAVPHGWQRDHLLGFSGDGAPYIDRPYSGGLTRIDTWQSSGQWTFDSCATAMDNCK